ncbi:unnamed protein product [Mytilus coruscus]|uniref:Uncharacterized protein n=1 Tax=Mytilus coruscus TaxID=42192 RepID=A0A6J8CTD7_MYTCO|nr:unnamed protein product [Mytilus coruscus]
MNPCIPNCDSCFTSTQFLTFPKYAKYMQNPNFSQTSRMAGLYPLTFTKRVAKIKKSLEYLNTKYETSKQEQDTVKSDIEEIKQCYTDVSSNITNFCADLEDLKERHIDLQTLSTLENLVFSGIPQIISDEESEETEQILIHFMKTSLRIENPI